MDDTPALVTLDRARQSPQLAKIADDATLSELILAASCRIEDFLGRRLSLLQRTERYDGSTLSGTPTTAILLKAFPVTDVSAVNVLGLDTTYPSDAYAIPTTDLVVDPSRGTLHFANYGLVSGYWHYFPRGIDNIEVTYTGGFATVPAVIRQATVMLAIRMWTAALRDPSEAAEKLGNYSVNYRFSENTETDLPAEISGAISRYRDWRT